MKTKLFTTALLFCVCANSYAQDMLSFNVLSPFFNSLQLSYEHFNTKGNLSVKIPVTINYSYANFNIGIDFKYFPTRQGAVRYFIAPCFRVGYKENQQYGMRYRQ
jgi:hypothetical protein